MGEIKWIPLRTTENPLPSLEERLARMKGAERQRELHGVYKQLATSHKGRQTHGFYRDFTEAHPQKKEDLGYGVAKLLEKYGMPDHAIRLNRQYNELSTFGERLDAPDF